MKTLFLTYAWKDNDDSNIEFVAQELRKAGVEVVYDKIALRPGIRLWQQIGDKIAKGTIDGWAYLVTPASLASEACLEEYYIALGRALETRGGEFPLIALVQGGSFDALPPGLKIRLGVSLQDNGWIDRVVAALERRPPPGEAHDLLPFATKMYEVGTEKLFEVRWRVGAMTPWRIAIPLGEKERLLQVGEGAPGGWNGSSILFDHIQASNTAYYITGARGPLSGTNSLYLKFSAWPSLVKFGSGRPGEPEWTTTFNE